MATAIILRQDFLDLRDGTAVCTFHVKLLSASDTITVPDLAVSTSGLSVKQVKTTSGEPTLTVTNSGNTVTLAGGVAGDQAMIVSTTRQINSDTRTA